RRQRHPDDGATATTRQRQAPPAQRLTEARLGTVHRTTPAAREHQTLVRVGRGAADDTEDAPAAHSSPDDSGAADSGAASSPDDGAGPPSRAPSPDAAAAARFSWASRRFRPGISGAEPSGRPGSARVVTRPASPPSIGTRSGQSAISGSGSMYFS